MEFRNTNFDAFNRQNDGDLNERYTSYNSTTMQMEGTQDQPKKPDVSGTARSRMNMINLNKR